jgi:hypothetical protein
MVSIFLIAAAIVTGCGVIEKFEIRSVKKRVDVIFKGIKTADYGRSVVGDEQLAICQWYANVPFLSDMGTLNIATDEFDLWRRRGGIFPYIVEYTIDKVKLIRGTKNTYRVYGTINGSDYIIRVPAGDTITWERTPFASFDFFED